MTRFQSIVAAALLMAATALIFLVQGEGMAMAHADGKLGWEWRAGRALAQRAAIRIEAAKKEGGGLFGIGKSPSLGAALPDAMTVSGHVVAIDRPGVAKPAGAIGFRIPRVELKSAKVGDLVAIGIIGDAVVCLTPAPSGIADTALAAWLVEAPCG
jgi:hypothetical protein